MKIVVEAKIFIFSSHQKSRLMNDDLTIYVIPRNLSNVYSFQRSVIEIWW